MSFIVLLTDFGLENNFTGVVKGVIYSVNPEAKIIDLTHNISPQDIKEGAFYLLTSYKYFPQNTIFVVVIDPGVGSKRKIVLVKTAKYYFLAPDNGVLSWVLKKEKIERIIEVSEEKYFINPVSSTFHARDIFAPVAGYLSKGSPVENFGKEVKRIAFFPFPQPKIEKNFIKGKILLIDRFGNAITNLSLKEFDFLREGNFVLKIKSAKVTRVHKFYSEVEKKDKEPFIIAGSSGFWEISLNQKNFAKEFNIGKEREFLIEITKAYGKKDE
ncbi:SAM-dependent chlorinase/fluorinase [Candidatus Aerophobetes bacterium]|nr:SAM-dependent chlorinase/fluorinase [Candidatus Aerophobetes bacterium]